jgi:glycosyltransferase involved in cell wall biosynthesis
MKVALYVHCFFPTHYHGTETYTLALARALCAMGHQPIVVSSMFQGEKKSSALITNYEYQDIPVYCIDKNYIPHSSLKETYFQEQMTQIHKKLLEELRPDVIHVTHLINHTAALLDAAKSLDIPTVATFTDFFGFCFNNKLETANGNLCVGPNLERTNCFTCCLKAGVRKANFKLSEQALNGFVPLLQLGSSLFNQVYDLPILKNINLSAQLRDIKLRSNLLAEKYSYYRAVIAPTNFLQSAYENNGFTSAPIYKINFGVDIDRKPKPLTPASAPIRFGFIGQIAPHKGTALLVEAFCRLPKGKSELHIYGAEDQYPEYTQAMKARSNGFPVYFQGTFASDQMRRVLDAMDFLVIPSTWYENSPLVLLDALASHIPVIVSDVEGLTEFLELGKNGYAFARGSVDELEKVMHHVISNPESSRQLSLTTNYVKTTLKMTEEIIDIYKSIV